MCAAVVSAAKPPDITGLGRQPDRHGNNQQDR